MIDLEQAIGATPDGGNFQIPPSADGKPWANVYLRNIKKPLGITVVPQVPGSPACAVLGFVLQGSEGITFGGGLELIVDPTQQKAFAVQVGDRIHLKNLLIHGAGVRDGLGVSFSDATNCTLEACELRDMNGGVTATRVTSLAIDANKVHDIGNDGMQFNTVNQVAITGNDLTNFFPAPGDHSDAMQFLGGGADITISGNTYTRGAGPVPVQPTATDPGVPGTQGLFMADGAYQRVTVKKNAFMGTIWHGIMVAGVDQLLVDQNLVVGYADCELTPWILADASCTSGTVSNNETTSLNHPAASSIVWTGNEMVAKVAPADAAAMIAAWRTPTPAPAPPSPAPPPAVDPREAQIATLTAKAATLASSITAIKALAIAGRKARSKNPYFDQIVAAATAAGA